MKLAASVITMAAVVLCSGLVLAREPVIGGPCEGCENVFAEMPAQVVSAARIAPPDEPGVPMMITGTVRAKDGTPAAGIIVYAYHTDAAGVYPAALTRHGRLRGWARTDQHGEYRFSTTRPGAYPEGGVPEHVHMHVIEPGRATYYIDDLVFGDDPLLTARHRQVMRGRGGDGLSDPRRDDNGVWQVRRDIVLGLNIPGYESSERR